MKNRVIKLVAVTAVTEDADGFKIGGEEITKDVFAEVKSVGYTEFYEGLKDGIKASLIFKVNMPEFFVTETVGSVSTDYKPTKIIFDGTDYKIVRQYRRGNGFLEVTCEEIE